MTALVFDKYEGLGNDFIVVEADTATAIESVAGDAAL